jgi:hypothetical protein
LRAYRQCSGQAAPEKPLPSKEAIKKCQTSDERASREHYFLETEKRSERFPDAAAKMPTLVKGEAA